MLQGRTFHATHTAVSEPSSAPPSGPEPLDVGVEGVRSDSVGASPTCSAMHPVTPRKPKTKSREDSSTTRKHESAVRLELLVSDVGQRLEDGLHGPAGGVLADRVGHGLKECAFRKLFLRRLRHLVIPPRVGSHRRNHRRLAKSSKKWHFRRR